MSMAWKKLSKCHNAWHNNGTTNPQLFCCSDNAPKCHRIIRSLHIGYPARINPDSTADRVYIVTLWVPTLTNRLLRRGDHQQYERRRQTSAVWRIFHGFLAADDRSHHQCWSATTWQVIGRRSDIVVRTFWSSSLIYCSCAIYRRTV